MNTKLKNHIVKNAKIEWSSIAGEELKVEMIKGELFAYGSELAVLRLFNHFNGQGTAEYSLNLETWYYSKS